MFPQAELTISMSCNHIIMMPGSKGLSPHELAHRWVKDLRTRHDMRILGGIVGVRSTEQSAGIKVGGF